MAALEALTDFGSLQDVGESVLTIRMDSDEQHLRLENINNLNQLELTTRELDPATKELDISVRGHGCVVLEFVRNYHTPVTIPEIKDPTESRLEIEVYVRYGFWPFLL